MRFGTKLRWSSRSCQRPALPCDNTRWCAQYTGGGGTNCGFFTIEQCRATVSGIGGFCVPNQFYNPCGSASRRTGYHYNY